MLHRLTTQPYLCLSFLISRQLPTFDFSVYLSGSSVFLNTVFQTQGFCPIKVAVIGNKTVHNSSSNPDDYHTVFIILTLID